LKPRVQDRYLVEEPIYERELVLEDGLGRWLRKVGC
jgi:hypothetical protein